jgi:hypothetical protein
MKLLINYANKIFRESQENNTQTALETAGFDKVIEYKPEDIDRVFYKKNKHILRSPIGNGYWLWKPYFMKKALNEIDEGDYLFYCDSGAVFINSIDPLIDICENEQDVVCFEIQLEEKCWTKRDTFILMDCDKPEYFETKQRVGGYILLKKTDQSVSFVDDYLKYCQNENLIKQTKNKTDMPDYPCFQEHRHDQSVFSLLTKKYGFQAYRDPSQWGNEFEQFYPNSPYPQIIESTRKRNESITGKIFRKIKEKIIK